MGNTMSPFRGIQIQQTSTQGLASQMNGMTSSSGDIEIGDLLNGTGDVAGGVVENNLTNLFTGKDLEFDIDKIMSQLKNKVFGNIEGMYQKMLSKALMNLLGFDDGADTTKRVAQGTAESAKNTATTAAVGAKLCSSATTAIISLMKDGEVSVDQLSQALNGVVTTAMDASMISQELMGRSNELTDENAQLQEEAQQLVDELNGDETFLDENGQKTELKIEDYVPKTADEAPEGGEEGGDSGNTPPPDSKAPQRSDEQMKKLERLNEIREKLGANSKDICVIADALTVKSQTVEDTQAEASNLNQQLQVTTQENTQENAKMTQDLVKQGSEKLMGDATSNVTENLENAVDATGNATNDGIVGAEQAAVAATTETASFGTASAYATKLMKNSVSNIAASAANSAFGGTAAGNAVKDLIQGKTLSNVLQKTAQNLAMQEVSKLIDEAGLVVPNAFEGTIFQDTFASMTNVSGWMKEGAGMLIEKPFEQVDPEAKA